MNGGYVIIGQDPKTLDFWYHERENNNGKPGAIQLMGDGKGDVRGMVNDYVHNGYDPEKIILNGQPITDVFTRTTDKDGQVVFKGHGKIVKNDNGDKGVRQVIETQSGVIVKVPVMLGSETIVKPLTDGTYKVISKPVNYYGDNKESVKILTEEELIEKFSKHSSANEKLDVMA